MRTLVTMGGQHQGIAALPGCNVSSADAGSCLKASAFVAKDAYGPWVNTHVVQAQYFKDPNQLDRYLARRAQNLSLRMRVVLHSIDAPGW